jgi:hypothetical protein
MSPNTGATTNADSGIDTGLRNQEKEGFTPWIVGAGARLVA